MRALAEIIERNRAGEAVGLPSWCTARSETLGAILQSYRDDDAPILIEATCNQVNQFGGYTGMTPAGFRRFVEGIAVAEGVDAARLILGGGHLGPNPWKDERADTAMDNARAMGNPNDLVAILRAAMLTDPSHWRAYIAPGEREESMMLCGLSDHVRYCWPRPEVRRSLDALFATIRSGRPEPGLVAQATGGLVAPVDRTRLPQAIIDRMVEAVATKYRNATGGR